MSDDRFAHGHATHPNWQMATELALAQIESTAKAFGRGTLGFVYITSNFARHAAAILDLLKTRTGIAQWVGTTGHSICATGVEYTDEPAISIMLGEFNPNSFQVFSGKVRPPLLDSKTKTGSLAAFTALVHLDPTTPDASDLIVDMAAKTESGFLFGGLTSGREEPFVQFAGDTFTGGLSGVVFASDVQLHTRVTQGCTPLGREHRITRSTDRYVQELDGKPALDVMLEDLGVPESVRSSRDGHTIIKALPPGRIRKGLMIGTARPTTDRGLGFGDLAVRHVLGIDPDQRIVAVADNMREGDRLLFCTRDETAARTDLIRICAELRDEVESQGQHIKGAHYVSCVARSGQLFGGPASEMRLIDQQLGNVPVVGFYANGEIARDRLYGYTGVLTVFS